MKVLIVGGYGAFGGRLVDLLKGEARLRLVVAGRSLASAEAFCAARLGAAASLAPARFDRDGDLGEQLTALKPDIVIDASGPFQRYGADGYRLPRACIAARAHYLDLADGATFVAGVDVFDEAARAAGVHVLSGASTLPALTAAAVRRLAADMSQIEAVEAGIATSPFAAVGASVVRAIADYAGQPVAYLGPVSNVIGSPFLSQRRYTVAPPGRLPLRSGLFSLVDTPDLRALPELWPSVKRIWIGASPAPEILHRALMACAWLVPLGIMRSLAPLAPLMHWIVNRARWGEHRSGMYVEVSGLDAEGAVSARSWHLVAEGDDGPLIPAMAAQAIVLKHLDGAPPEAGARACVRDLELEDYDRVFAGRRIFTGVRAPAPADAPLYRRLLGEAWDDLPAAVRAMHDGAVAADGACSVERGTHPLARLAAWMMSFPPAAQQSEVRVRFEAEAGGERWTRSFGASQFSSRQYEGEGKSARLLCERFGPLEFAMALVCEEGRLRFVLRRWSVFGLPLPLWLAPRSDAYESEEAGVFRFHVELAHPLTGLIVRYRGWLKPQAKEERAGAAADAAPERTPEMEH